MVRRLVLATLLGLSTGGCMAFSLGGGSTIERALTPPTLGREFEDLQDAYKKGALTKNEYDQARQKLISDGRKF